MPAMAGDRLAHRGARRRLVAAVACVGGLAAGACGGDPGVAQTGVGDARTTPTPTVTGPSDVGADVPAPEPYPSWNAQARRTARARALTAMRRFARPRLGAEAWWTGLAPLLSPAAAIAYQGTDPANIPVRAVTGATELVDQSSPYLASVRVATDVGAYLVLLSRAGQGSGWRVERFRPPRRLRTP